MATVWILGAGASRAEHPDMPLVDDFIRIAFSLRLFSDRAGEEFIASICKEFGYTQDELRTRVNIEELLTLAASDFAWRSVEDPSERTAKWLPGAVGSLALISSLESLIASVLFQLQRQVFAKATSLHDALAERMENGDAVISYNYDLLIDYALRKADKSSVTDYAIEFTNSLDGAEPRDSELRPYEAEPAGPVQLLKLHGSLNWLQIEREELGSAAEFLTVPHPVFYLRDAFEVCVPSFSLRRSDYHAGRNNSVHLTPVIVPPTFDKAEIWHSKCEAIRGLWSRAREALLTCERIVVIGHSLREADYQSRWLLRVALAANARSPAIAIVNKCSKDRERLGAFFSSLGTVEEYCTVEAFLSGKREA